MTENEIAKIAEVRLQKGLVFVCAPITLISIPLFPVEVDYIKKAVEKRKCEFVAGRTLARYAMKILGFKPCEILTDCMRAPVWPDGITGSITHTDSHCAVLVGMKERFLSVGIDMEDASRLTEDIWKYIFTENELKWLKKQPMAKRQKTACEIYMTKEAYYKMQYPLTGLMLDFKDAEIMNDRSNNLWITPLNGTAGTLDRSFRAIKYSCLGNECILVLNQRPNRYYVFPKK